MRIGPSPATGRPVHAADPVNPSYAGNHRLAAWWIPLPDLQGGRQWIDVTARGRHATLTSMGNTSNGWRPAAPPGGFGSLLFDGSAGYATTARTTQSIAQLSASDGLIPQNEFTFAAWAFPTGTAATAANAYGLPAICGEDGGYLSLSRGIIGGLDRIWAFNYPGTETRVGGAYTAGKWVHAMWTHTGGSLYLYLNGQSAGSVASGQTSVLSGTWLIGKQYTSTPFAGSVADVKVWSRGFSAADAADAYGQAVRGYPDALNRMGSYAIPSAASGTPFAPLAASYYAHRRRTG